MSNVNPVNYQTFYTQRAANASNGQGGSQKEVTIQQCIRNEIQDCFVIKPLEKPVKVHKLEDVNVLSYEA